MHDNSLQKENALCIMNHLRIFAPLPKDIISTHKFSLKVSSVLNDRARLSRSRVATPKNTIIRT